MSKSALPGGTPDSDSGNLRRENERLRAELERYREAADVLRDTEHRLRIVVENAPIVLFATDRDGRFTLSVGRGLASLGLKPGEVVGQSAFEVYRGTPQIAANLRRCLDGESVNDVVRVGENVYESLYTPLLDADGNVTGVSGLAWDVSKRVRAEEAARSLETQLHQAQKIETIGTLAGGIAHDFNNILSPILGYTDIAMGLIDPDHPAHRDLQEVLNAAQRAKELVQQILIFARGGDQQKRPVQAHLVILEALRLIRSTLPTTIEISQRVATRDDVVMADPAQIHQVIMNLCTNAAYAMRERGGVLRVELTRRHIDEEESAHVPGVQAGQHVVLTVRDDGEGMEAGTVSRIFEPFFTTKPPGQGTGLGLSVVHGIVHSHGGGIRVESTPGKGATFHVYLPAVASQAAMLETSQDQPPDGVGGRILVVDDEPEITRMLARMLEARGYHVTAYNSAVEALAAVRADPRAFDAVITDNTMPRIRGVDLAKRIHEERADLPVILTTGYGQRATQDSMPSDVSGIAEKPFDATTLIAMLRRAMTSS